MDDDPLRFPQAPADLDELIDLGIIQEANRRFFHILGFELVTRVDADRGLVLELHGGGCDEAGLTFGHSEPTWSAVRRERARMVQAMYVAALAARREALGYTLQPIDDL